MENKTVNCSSIEAHDIDTISYCGECKIYMRMNCEKFHSKLLSSHQTYNLELFDDIFTGFENKK